MDVDVGEANRHWHPNRHCGVDRKRLRRRAVASSQCDWQTAGSRRIGERGPCAAGRKRKAGCPAGSAGGHIGVDVDRLCTLRHERVWQGDRDGPRRCAGLEEAHVVVPLSRIARRERIGARHGRGIRVEQVELSPWSIGVGVKSAQRSVG